MDIRSLKRSAEASWKQMLYDMGVPMTSPPHGTKRRVVADFATRFKTDTMVETGTFMGDMVERMRPHFKTIHSIELSQPFHAKAVERFKGVPNIHLHCGDSATMLAKVLEQCNSRCLFWLDAHFSGGETARADKDTPIMAELQVVFDHKIKDHVILIDDARLFVGKDDYPTLEGLKSFVLEHRPNYAMTVEHDIIRLVPDSIGGVA